jgi:2-dehydropantoate 2-reductase
MNSLIVGPGAIGSLVCGHVQTFSQVFAYPHRANITLADELITNTGPVTLNWTIQPTESPRIDVIWVTCKANQVIETVAPLLERHADAIAILLHNGLGPQEALKSMFNARVLLGSTTCGALKSSQTQFTQTSFGQTDIDFPSSPYKASAIGKLLQTPANNLGPLNIQSNSDLNATLWKKVLINACINPLTAYFQVQNSHLLEPQYADEISNLCYEINSIMAHKGMVPIENPEELVRTVAKLSAQNWSSMAVDVKEKRQTEIDYINGYLIKQAETLGLSTPNLKKWYKRIATASYS